MIRHDDRMEIRLPRLLHAQLQVYAARRGETVSEVIRQAIQAAVKGGSRRGGRER